MYDRPSRRKKTFAVGVSGGIRQIADHVLHDLVGRLQPEGRKVANVEFYDVLPGLLHFMGEVENRPANVVKDIVELSRFCDGSQGNYSDGRNKAGKIGALGRIRTYNQRIMSPLL